MIGLAEGGTIGPVRASSGLMHRSNAKATPQASQEIRGSQISDESVPETRRFILGTSSDNRVLLWHGGYRHAFVLLTDHNLRSDVRSERE